MCGGICKVGTFQETWFYTPNSNVKLDLTFSLFFLISQFPSHFSDTLSSHFFSQSHSVPLSAHFLSSCSLKLSSQVMLFLIFCSHDHDLQWSSPSFIFYFYFFILTTMIFTFFFFFFFFFHSHAFFELSSHLHLLWFEISDFRLLSGGLD